MSFDDDYSDEVSYDESSTASGVEEPPTLDETLFDISLFNMFMNHMKSQQAAPNLHFLKQARLFRLYNVPREVYLMQGIKMIWTYFSDCAPMPVTVSDEVRKNLIEMSLNPDMEAKLDKDAFSVAFGEVYNAVVPHFRNWISTDEWREAVPFHHLAPPTFNIVLTSSTLRVLFNKYMKGQLEHDGKSESVLHAYHLWKFCIIANDFREGKYSHASHLESKKKKGEAAGDEKSELSEKSLKADADPEKGKDVNPEDYAKRLYKRYKHQVSLPYDGSIPYAVYIIRALDRAVEDFDKSAIFSKWINLKQYQGVDYQAKVVHQSLTADGHVEPPSVAAAMASSMLPFFLVMMSGTENGMNLQFMVDALKFHQTYASLEKEKDVVPLSPTGQNPGTTPPQSPRHVLTPSTSMSNMSSSSSSEPSHKELTKEMVDEARRIYAKYLETGDMYCDPHLVEEVRAALGKSGGKGVTPSMFRKCGAFIYQRAEHTWGREARATIAWANKSYDNRCRKTRAIEEEFSMKVLPEGMDLQVVPNIDDVLQNPELSEDFGEYCGKEVAAAFLAWRKAYVEYFQSPIHLRKPALLKLVDAFGQSAKLYPTLQPVLEVITKETQKRDKVPDSAILYCTIVGLRESAKKYFLPWLVDHNMKWKTVPWTPAQNLMFSDMTMVYGMGTIEKMIEEKALKGKSGIQKMIAKRQVKKHSVANVRTSPSAELAGPSKTVFATGSALEMMSFARNFGKTDAPEETSSSDQFTPTIPSLAETLAAPYLRKFFEDTFLGCVLSATEVTLWEALTGFYTKYITMDSEELCDAQDAMRKDIEEICDKYHSLLEDKKVEAIRARAKKAKIIFPQFFRPFEMELYANAHSSFEETLKEKGWK